MSEVKINELEKDDCTEILIFLENLSPELKERFKTIMWWESMKPKEPDKEEVTAVWGGE